MVVLLPSESEPKCTDRLLSEQLELLRSKYSNGLRLYDPRSFTVDNLSYRGLESKVPVREALEIKMEVDNHFAKFGITELYLSEEWPYTPNTLEARDGFRRVASSLFSQTERPTLYNEALRASNPLKACMDVWIEECRKFSREKLFDLMESGIDIGRVSYGERDEYGHYEKKEREQTFKEYLEMIEDTFTNYNPCADDGKSFQYFLLAVVPAYFKKSMRSVLSSISVKLSINKIKCFILKHEEAFVAERAAWNKAKEEAEGKGAEGKAAEEKAALEKAALEKAAEEKAALEKATLEKAAQEKAAEEKAALEKAAQEKAAQEKAALEKAAEEKAAEVKEAEAKATETDNVKTEAVDNERSNECVKPTTAELNRRTDLVPCSLRSVARVLVTGNGDQLKNMRKAPRISITSGDKTYTSNQVGVYSIPVRGADGSTKECEVSAYYVPDFTFRFQMSRSDQISFDFTVVMIEKDFTTVTSKEGATFFKRAVCPKATISTDQSFPELQLSE